MLPFARCSTRGGGTRSVSHVTGVSFHTLAGKECDFSDQQRSDLAQ